MILNSFFRDFMETESAFTANHCHVESNRHNLMPILESCIVHRG